MRFIKLSYILSLLLSLLILSCGTENTPTYEISTSVSPNEGGEISISPEGKVHDEKTTLTLTPQPSEGYLFSRWEGDYSSTNNPLTFSINEDVSVTGVFAKKEYSLNVKTKGEGEVKEEVVKQKNYKHGTIVRLIPKSSDGWEFSNWTGDISSTQNPIEVKVESELNITATFKLNLKTFGGSSSDFGYSGVQTTDGGSVITGISDSKDGIFNGMNNGNSDIFVLKLDANANIQWIKTFGGISNDDGLSIIQTSDGGFAVTGWTVSNSGDFEGMNQGGEDIFVLKLDSNGTQKWVKTFGGSGSEMGHTIIETSDNGFLITGPSDSNDGNFSNLNNGESDIFILKIDSDGKKQWVKTFGGTKRESGHSLQELKDGGYLVTGFSESNDGDFHGLNNGAYDTFILKIDTNGNGQWVKMYGGTGTDVGKSVIQISSGNYLVLGSTKSNDGDFSGLNNGGSDTFVLNLDLNGDKNWVKTIGGSLSDNGQSIVEKTNGGLILTGYTYSNDGDFSSKSRDGEDVFISRLDSNGNMVSLEVVGGSKRESPRSIYEVSDGYIVTGFSKSSDGAFLDLNKGEYDIFILKINQD